MKTFYRFIILVFVVGFFTTSCEKVVSLADVKFDSTFKTDLDFDFTTNSLKTSANGTFFVEAEIDPALDEEYEKYFDKIKEINIKSARIEVISIDPSVVNLLRAHLFFKAEGHEAIDWSFENIEFSEGAYLELGENKWPDILEILKEKLPFKVTLSGVTDVDEGSCKARIILTAGIVANPLE